MDKNELNHCESPYLQQHATNPVHWLPFDENALEKARERQKPILLSIGYSACHWCHVMAHESFEDEQTAALMNQLFVNIKVDKEERPDIDRIFQTCHQILNQQSGGWPLTVFLDPDTLLPFFSGTYFPKAAKHGLPAFSTVLNTLSDLFQNQPEAIKHQNLELKQLLSKVANPKVESEGLLSEEPVELALDQLEEDFDPVNGGFGKAPKFPLPTNLQRLLRRYNGTPRDKTAQLMLRKTLDAMAMGGIYDQIGGGFFRYSVDARFEIPHFEKMLYDNGPLIALYAQARVLLKAPHYGTVAKESANWALKKMRHPKGGFYTSLDADSLGIEGKFYLWDIQEVKALLEPEAYELLTHVFNFHEPQNFKGLWHLHQVMPIAQLDEVDKSCLTEAKRLLLQTRRERIAPHKDEKILTGWNGLMSRGLALAGFLLHETTYTEAAERALLFIKDNLYVNQTLHACYKDNKAYNAAYLDDYAFVIDAILFQLQAKYNEDLFNFAITLADECLEKFYDSKNGGFYFTSEDHPAIITRQKIYSDEALPSGNGIMAFCLNRLGHLCRNMQYLEAAEKTLQSAWQHIEAQPLAHNSLLNALEELLNPPEIAMIFYKDEADLLPWRRAFVQHYNTHRLSIFISEAEQASHPCFKSFKTSGAEVTVYRCKDQYCKKSITELSELF